MALEDLSFKFYNEDTLSTAFTGTLSLVNKTDLSDNPQDFVLYFGSTETGHTLQTSTSPGTNQITLTPANIAAEWENTTAYTLGNLIEPTTPNNFIYKCTTAGTSHATTEPTWPTSIGSTVVDGTVVWTCYAHSHPITEIKLALSSGGLPGATGGASLNLGTTLTSGVSNAIPVYIRITNTVTDINTNVGYPQLGININSVQEAG